MITARSFYEPRGLLALIDDEPVGLVHYFYLAIASSSMSAAGSLRNTSSAGAGVGRALIEAVYTEGSGLSQRLLDDAGIQRDSAQAL
jgi:hypothetical protein